MFTGSDLKDVGRGCGCVIVTALVVLAVVALFIGRCSAKYQVRSPIVTKETT